MGAIYHKLSCREGDQNIHLQPTEKRQNMRDSGPEVAGYKTLA